MFALLGIDNMYFVENTENYWGSGHCPSSGMVKTRKYYVRLEVFTGVTLKNGVFCVVTPCVSCKNRHFGGN
jgi:hypothetical protein